MTPTQAKQYRTYLISCLPELSGLRRAWALDRIEMIDNGTLICSCGRERDDAKDPICTFCLQVMADAEDEMRLEGDDLD